MLKKLFSNKRNIIIVSILGILLIGGLTYALINWQSNNYNVAIKSSCMNINYTKGQDIDKNLGVIDESLYINGNTITMNSAMAFSSVEVELDSACDIDGLANIEVNVTSLSNDLKSGGKYYGGLKYVVVEYDPTDYSELTMSQLENKTFNIVSAGIISNTGTIDAHTSYIGHGSKKNFLVIFYASKLILKNDLVDLSFDGNIGARVEQFVPTPITDFTYTLTNGNVRITKYNGTASRVNLAPTYTINNVVYNTVVYGNVFASKTTVQEVNFADGITADSGYAYQMFYGCTNLIKVSGLPNNITNLSYGFYNCTRLVNAPSLGNGVQDMSYAFYGCSQLKNISIIPNSVTNMSYTFYNCTSLVDAPALGNSVQDMSYAFSGCSNLVNASALPNSVTNISYAFQNCTSLVNAPVLGSSVQDMSYAFSGCSNLVNVPTLPNSVTNMLRTFSGCTSLVNAPLIPNSVTNMGGTFRDCTSLVDAPIIPNFVTNMGSTFYGCSSLVNAPVIPSSVTYLNSTFYGCTSLVNAPEIPDLVTNMNSTFSGCTNLTGTIRINSTSVSRTSGSSYHPFYNTSKPITVEVPSGSNTTYTIINNNKPSNVTITRFS